MTLREIVGLSSPGPEAWRLGFTWGALAGGAAVALVFLLAALVLTRV